MQNKLLVQYSLYSFRSSYWRMNGEERRSRLHSFLGSMHSVADSTHCYQVYPASDGIDLLVWNTIFADEPQAAQRYFMAYARCTNPHREHFKLEKSFWGVTKPSQYSKAKRSTQEIDPFGGVRSPYFIIYPFSKTTEWYLKSREERQEMMNEHIRIGKTYGEINQLLLYSFGMQDQEFVVAYETEDIAHFGQLVYDLRSTEARLFTLRDTPIITALHRTHDELLDIFSHR